MRELLNNIFHFILHFTFYTLHFIQKQPLHTTFFYILILFLPTQFSLHFWPAWSLVNGQRIDYLSPTLYFTDILIFLTLFFWLSSNLSNLSNWSKSIKKNSIIIITIFILFFIFYLNPFVHLFKLFKILEFYLLFLYIKNNLTIRQFNNSAILLMIGLIFESILSLFQFLNQQSINSLFYFFGERSFASSTPGIAQAIINGQLILRPYGTFSHPNSLAGYFLVCLFLIYACPERSEGSLRGILSPSKKTKSPPTGGIPLRRDNLLNYCSIIVSCLIFLILFISFSRSAWLVGGFLFFSIGLLNIKKLITLLKNIKNKFLVFGLIFALCSLIFGLFPVTKARIVSIKTIDSQSVKNRLNLNSLALKMFLSSPLIGVGLNNFIPNIPRFTQNQPQIRLYQPVHNIYLLVLAESGLVGFSIFLYLIYKTITLSLRALPCRAKQSTQKSLSSIFYLQPPSSTLYLLSSLIVILLTGLFDHYSLTLQQNQLLLTLILGIIFANLKTNKK